MCHVLFQLASSNKVCLKNLISTQIKRRDIAVSSTYCRIHCFDPVVSYVIIHMQNWKVLYNVYAQASRVFLAYGTLCFWNTRENWFVREYSEIQRQILQKEIYFLVIETVQRVRWIICDFSAGFWLNTRDIREIHRAIILFHIATFVVAARNDNKKKNNLQSRICGKRSKIKLWAKTVMIFNYQFN